MLNGLKNKASNLCSEITLFSDEDHSYTCVLSSLNLSKFDEWKFTDTVFLATVFLDCVVEGFLDRLTGLTRAEQKATKEFIAARVAESKIELHNAESALQAYKEKNKIIDPSENTKVIADRVVMVDKVKAENRDSRKYLI